ncbi:type IV pilus modification protein PilV [Halomonas alimentaria]|uniref:type IV pilus modification protein PilV n=1 Tax=Halomonas alimentaria TaxID=147248 RepID=UPI00249066CF|nr:type IV pilus modification protein PilV [Halomonas alimentaria]
MASRSSVERGFTLIEALVALLVLSIGMLGVAAMQLKALQGAHAAYQRSIASLAAQDAQERLWAQLAVGGGTCPSWDDAKNIGSDDGIAPWEDSWSEYLRDFDSEEAGVGGSVSPSATPNDDCEFDITVSWSESRFSNEDEPEFSYTIRLPGE